MNNKWLFPIVLLSLCSCHTSDVKEVYIDASCIAKSQGGKAVKGFMLHNFSFRYTLVSADEDNNFVIEKDGYIESDASIPYSYLKLNSDKLMVTVCNLGYVEDVYTYVDITEVNYEDDKEQYTYYLKGYQKVRISNNNEEAITLSPLYFYAEM